MTDHDAYPLTLPGFESVDSNLVSQVMAIESRVSRYTSIVHFKNHGDIVEAAWQDLCDGFETSEPDSDEKTFVDGNLRHHISEIRFVGHYENLQEALEISPVELLLRMGDKLIAETDGDHDKLFAHLLRSYVDSRSAYGPDPSGTEPRSKVRFQAAKAAHQHLDQFRRQGQNNRYVDRIERVLKLADLEYRPLSSRIRRLGSSLIEKVTDLQNQGFTTDW